MGKDSGIEIVRLARSQDYPATRLIELPTHVSTGDDFSDSFDIAETVLGKEVQQGSLFAYLFRRFGNPNKGSDPDKELAAYLLTTTRKDMLLKIVPYAGGDVSISFTFLVPHDVRHLCDDWMSRDRDAHQEAFVDWIEAEGRVPEWAEDLAEKTAQGSWPVPEGATGWRRMMTGVAMIAHFGVREGDEPDKVEAIRWYQSVREDYEALHPVPPVQWRTRDVATWEDDDPKKPYAEAMMATLRDLLRPVWIRDVAIGIHGQIDEQDPEALGNTGPDADIAASAGYPSGDLGNRDAVGFAALHGAILRLDPDASVAMARAMELIEAAAKGEDPSTCPE